MSEPSHPADVPGPQRPTVAAEGETPTQPGALAPGPHRRRARYPGRHPRRFEHKYKEHDPARYPDTVATVMAAGKTPAGSHRPIMVAEALAALAPKAGETAVDATLGYGGHAREWLPGLLPGGQLIGLDADPVELPKAEARLRALGFGPETFRAHRTNFAGLPQVLAAESLAGVDGVLADLGVSSMQLDEPARGFSVKYEGPLDMRMNPRRGQPAADWLGHIGCEALERVLRENADEPRAETLAAVLAGRSFTGTTALAAAVRTALSRLNAEEQELSIRRVFQAIRIAVNDEFGALDALLRHLPACLNPGGRVVILSFHSGEDRRVKRAFAAGRAAGVYAEIAPEVIRPSPAERQANPRSIPAKLRWARRAVAPV